MLRTKTTLIKETTTLVHLIEKKEAEKRRDSKSNKKGEKNNRCDVKILKQTKKMNRFIIIVMIKDFKLLCI